MQLTPPALLEALLFAAGEPIGKKRLASLIGVSPDMLSKAAEILKEELSGRGISLIETEDELELRTSAEASGFVKKLREAELSRDLGKAGLETLAVVLYRGSATRSEIDWIRGVNSSTSLRSLLLRGLIEKTEDTADRRRARYKPTIDALAHLGLTDVKELPRYAEFAGLIAEREVEAQPQEV
jgi:segregation and condensation protein B